MTKINYKARLHRAGILVVLDRHKADEWYFETRAMGNKLASLEATLVRNYDPLTHSLTVKCRATSVAKKNNNNKKDKKSLIL